MANLQSCYKIEDTNKTWSSAHDSCKGIDSKLASIGSQEENDFLEKALKEKEISSCVHLGLRANEENDVSWIDGNVWDFSRLRNESDNTSGLCVERATDGSWRFINCTKQCMYICKRYRGKPQSPDDLSSSGGLLGTKKGG